ncbi:MAG: hypothetical protein KDD50_04825 [Bdellovibrionales bacterium]|nr:hypothetical protein [Bdellovibrionales bacterium]
MNNQIRNILIAAIVVMFSLFKLSTLLFNTASDASNRPDISQRFSQDRDQIEISTAQQAYEKINESNRSRKWNTYNTKSDQNLFKVAQENLRKKLSDKMKPSDNKKQIEAKNKKEKDKKKKLKTGKTKDKKKDEKDKKKEKTPVFVSNDDLIDAEEASRKEDDQEIVNLQNNQNINTTAANPVDQQQDDQTSPNYSDWADKLLRYPNKKALRELIQFKNANKISEELYYELITAMLEDSRDEMKFVGLLGLASEQNVKNFSLLSDFVKGVGVTSEIGVKAKSILSAYNEKSYLSILGSTIVGSSNEFAVFTAAQYIESIVKKDKQSLTHPELTSPSQEEQTSQVSSGEIKTLSVGDSQMYSRLLKDITTVSVIYSKSEIVSQLESAASAIKDILSLSSLSADQLADGSSSEVSNSQKARRY